MRAQEAPRPILARPRALNEGAWEALKIVPSALASRENGIGGTIPSENESLLSDGVGRWE